MNTLSLLVGFVGMRLLQEGLETILAMINHRYQMDPHRQSHARRILGIDEGSMTKSVAYASDRYRFGLVSDWCQGIATLIFLGMGGLGVIEALSRDVSQGWGQGNIVTGLIFFGILGLLGSLMSLPFDYYRVFVIEERHGFNRQTVRGFWLDLLKSWLLGAFLGGAMLTVILWIMEIAGGIWWLWAWGALSLMSLTVAWLYPSLLAPLFNKFRPLEDQTLKDSIDALAARVGFKTSGILVMDASRRSSHGNAYFTGILGKKRIVLFDTLLSALTPVEVTAVLAHELGHFKLKHVTWGLVRGLLTTGVMFYLLSLCLPLTSFYQAFGLAGATTYGALIVFSLWFGLLDFFLQPLSSYISRRHEFAADRFARHHMNESQSLRDALLKLRETSQAMPLSHPIYSAVYHSHPPLLERLEALAAPLSSAP